MHIEHAPGLSIHFPRTTVTLSSYQTTAARTMNATLSPDDRLLDAAAGLAEEGGEVLALIRKHRFQQRPLDRDEVAIELGDALWCLAMVATSLGLTLDDIADRNLAKLRARHPDGFTGPRSKP